MTYRLSVTVDAPFEDVLSEVRQGLAEQGFGVITEIDIQETLQRKIGAEVSEQVILGACSPRHAHRALQLEPSIGVLLPCNVVVRSTAEGTVVDAINPAMMVELTQSDGMEELAGEIGLKLSKVLGGLTGPQKV